MIEKITDQNLERYDSRLKEWCDRKFFEKGNYGKYQTTEEAGAVTFYPAPNTPLEGMVKFSFKETMPSEGEKGPDNPSTIIGVSNIHVTRSGKNLLDVSSLSLYTTHGITFTPSADGSILISGTHDGNAYYTLRDNLYFPVGETLYLSIKEGKNDSWNKAYLQLVAYDENNNELTIIGQRLSRDTEAITVPSGVKYRIRLAVLATLDSSAPVVITPMAEFVSLSQKGISFDDYDLYTIQFGDTYYGGSLDVATGVMTVTHVYVAFTGAEQNLNWGRTEKTATVAFNTSGAAWLNILPKPKNPANGPICTHFPFSYNASLDTTHFYVYSIGHVAFYYPDPSFTVEDWKSYLATQYAAGTPVTVCYEASIPLATIQLTPTQIRSLAQADKYTPRLNTVYTDADSVQISYLKSPIRDEYEKTQAILSLGGNS